MNSITLIGGARIGMMNASWPFARLKVDGDRIDLNVSLLGRYVFKPGDIVSIEPYSIIPVIGRGIKINHRVPNYKKKIIFWSFVNPEELVRRIRQTGFMDRNAVRADVPDAEIIAERQKRGGFPLKLGYSIGMVVVWNVLFMADFIIGSYSGAEHFGPGKGATAALALVFFSTVLMRFSERFRKLVLKEGRGLEDLGALLYLLMFVSGFMLLGFTMMNIPGE